MTEKSRLAVELDGEDAEHIVMCVAEWVHLAGREGNRLYPAQKVRLEHLQHFLERWVEAGGKVAFPVEKNGKSNPPAL